MLATVSNRISWGGFLRLLALLRPFPPAFRRLSSLLPAVPSSFLRRMPPSGFDLPVFFDLGATFAFALSGALAAIKRNYDIVGVLALALVSGIGAG